MADKTSFSELSTLARCEKQWEFKYLLREKRDASNAMFLGTLLHRMAGAWWEGEQWRVELWNAACEFMGVDLKDTTATCPLTDEGYRELLQAEPWVTAKWVMERYEEHYASAQDRLKVVGAELYAEALMPGTKTLIGGYFDQLVMDEDGDFWLVERKSMKDWKRLDLVTVDPQLTLYAWLLREIGVPIKGIFFDAIRTYRWKRDFHPTTDSFQWLPLVREDVQIDAALEDAKAGIQRRAMLRAGLPPMRNVTKDCGWCDFQPECFEQMSFGPQTVEMVTD